MEVEKGKDVSGLVKVRQEVPIVFVHQGKIAQRKGSVKNEKNRFKVENLRAEKNRIDSAKSIKTSRLRTQEAQKNLVSETSVRWVMV